MKLNVAVKREIAKGIIVKPDHGDSKIVEKRKKKKKKKGNVSLIAQRGHEMDREIAQTYRIGYIISLRHL